MSLVGVTLRMNVTYHYSWDDTKKEKAVVWRDDTLLVCLDDGYCRLLRLDDGHIFHMSRDEMSAFCKRV